MPKFTPTMTLKVLVVTKWGRMHLSTVETPPPKEFKSPSGKTYKRVSSCKLDLDKAKEAVLLYEEQ